MTHDLETLACEAEQIVRTIGLPPCPAVLDKFVREMRSEDPDFSRLGALIVTDVSLAASLLKMVNSPFYGLTAKATSIRQALMLVGLRSASQLISGLLLRQAFPAVSSAYMDEFWKSSVGIARVSVVLARRIRGMDPDVAYTFALFRDCGVPAMMSAFPAYVPPLSATHPSGDQSVVEVEGDTFGIHHAYMGYHLAKDWFLPQPVFQAVLWHHDYAALRERRAAISRMGTQLVALALAAEQVYTRYAMNADCGEWALHGEFALDELGMTLEDFEAAMPELTAFAGPRSKAA